MRKCRCSGIDRRQQEWERKEQGSMLLGDGLCTFPLQALTMGQLLSAGFSRRRLEGKKTEEGGVFSFSLCLKQNFWQ